MLHTGGGRGDTPPHNVERFECLEKKAEKRYINVINYYYYYYYYTHQLNVLPSFLNCLSIR